MNYGTDKHSREEKELYRPVDWVLVLMPVMVVEEVVTKHCGNGAETERLQYGSGKGAPERQVERWSRIKEGRKVGGGAGGGGGRS